MSTARSNSPGSHYDSEPELGSGSAMRRLAPESVVHKRKHEHVDGLNAFMTEMRKMFADFKKQQNDKYATLLNSVDEIKKQNCDIQASIEFISKQYDDLKEKCDKLMSEQKNNVAYVQMLEEKIEILERNSKSSSLELRNVPLRAPETKKDLTGIVINTAKALHLTIDTSDIRDVYRPKTKSESNKPIIVDFGSVLIKENVLQAVKRYNKTNTNKLSTSSIQLDGPPKQVFISENLTFKVKRLFHLARDFAKTNNYAFCWTSYGRIYLRKAEGAPALRIDAESDLSNLKTQK